MHKLRLINYMGSNGSGKSTRTFYLVKYLQEKFDFKEVYEIITRKGKEPKKENIGLLFSNGWFVLGKFAKGGSQWVSLDTAIYSNWDARLKEIPSLKEKYPEIETIFMEGYFNNRSKRGSIDRWEEAGCTEVHLLISYYDRIEEFIERTNSRTGKSRGLDWAENSSGWSDNILFGDLLEFYNENKGNNPDNIVERIPMDAERDILVKKYFGERYELKEESKSQIDEWI